MAVNRVQGVLGSGTGQTTAVTLTVSAGNLLTCMVQGGSINDTPLKASDGVNTWNNAPDIATDATLGNALGVAYAANIASGSTTVTGDASSSNSGHTIRTIVNEWSGIATTSVLRDHGSVDHAAGAVTTATVSTAGSAALSGDLGLSCINVGSAQTYSTGSWTGSPTVNLSDENPSAGGTQRDALQWVQVNTAGSQTSTMNWSTTSNNQILVILIFAQGSGTVLDATPAIVKRRRLDPWGLAQKWFAIK